MPTAMESTVGQSNTSDTNDGFFARPIKVATFTWRLTEDLYQEFNPWNLFMDDPRIANRLAHFRNMRCTIKVKFLLNGNPFYSGRLIASYQPLPKVDDVAILDGTSSAQLVNASQHPHVLLDPTTSQGGIIHCPFIFPKNAVEIPLAEWDSLGKITVSTLNTLQHANGGVEPLTVSVFVYSEDMDISTPTSRTALSIIPQGDVIPEGDEYGVVSGPAHSLANWSGKLANAPMIGRYARATSMISSAAGHVAQLFGFSRPRMLDRTATFRVTGSSLATTNVQDLCESLALDSKKEITIDPTVVGCEPKDDMAIIPLACRESYLQTFPWTLQDSPDQHLFSMRMSPVQGQLSGTNYHLTPAAWVALPFQYWTGSMQVRFQVVASAYHRGRIRIVWDPDFYDDALREEYNLNYSQILDLSENRDFSVKVGWGQATNYLEVGGMERSNLNHSFNPFSSLSRTCNGTLSVYVVNELTAPTDADLGVSFNVYTSMCDDFEVAGPTNRISGYEIANKVSVVAPVREFVTTPLVPALFTVARRTAIPPDPQNATSLALNNVNARRLAGTDSIRMETRSDGFSIWTYGDVGGGDNRFDMQILATGADTQIEILSSSGTSFLTVLLIAGQPTNISWFAPIDEGFRQQFFVLDVATNEQSTLVISSIGTFIPLGAFPFVGRVGNVETTNLTIASQGLTPWYEAPVGDTSASYDNLDFLSGVSVVSHVPISLYSREFGGTFESTDGSEGVVTNFVRNAVGQEGIEFGPPTNAIDPFQIRLGDIYYLKPPIITPQGDTMEQEAGESNVPEMETIHMYMGPDCVCGPMNQVYFGEQVASWRQVLRRYVTKYVITRNTGANESMNLGYNLPLYPDVSIGAATPTEVSIASADTLFDWVIPAYITVRGGMRIKIINGFGVDARDNRFSTMATRIPSYTSPDDLVAIDVLGVATFAGSSYEAVNLSGMHAVEFPFYSRYRFYPARSITFSDPLNYVERDMFQLVESTRGNVSTQILYSTAEDFSLSFFLSTPVVRIAV